MVNKIMSGCPYVGKCWRYSYSRYLLDIGYKSDSPPDRLKLLMSQYATNEMMTQGDRRASLYCEKFPHRDPDGELVNICPLLCMKNCQDCHEYKREVKRVEKAKASYERKRKYNESRRRVWIPTATRKKVCKRDKYKCVYCGRANNAWHGDKKIKIVIDHFIPLNKGGNPTHEDNLVVACWQCNRAKSDDIWQKGCRIGYYNKTEHYHNLRRGS